MYDTTHGDTHQERQDPFLEQLDQQINQHAKQRADLNDQVGLLLERLETEDRILTAALELHHRITGSQHPRDAEFQTSRRTPLGKVSATRAPTPDMTSLASDERTDRPVTVPAKGRLRDIYNILSTANEPVRLTDLARELQERGHLDGVENPTPATAAALSRGVKLGMFERVDRGLYMVRSTDEEVE